MLKKILSVTAILSVIFFAGCGGKNAGANEENKALKNDTIAVSTVQASEQILTINKTYIATLEGEEQANVVAKLAERIVTLKAKVGMSVAKGQLLVELDKSGASSMYYQAQAAFLNAEKDLNRMKALYAEGAISQQMLDGVTTQYNISKANFDAAKDAIELVAPISGIVTAINANAGDLAMPGMPLITIANISRIKAVVSLGEKELLDLTVAQPVKLFSDLKPDFIVNGTITEISKSADVESRTFVMKAVFANSGDRWFKPGMFCNVQSQKKSGQKSIVIPVGAIVLKGTETGTYVAENGRANYRKIITGISDGKLTEVLSGVNKSDKVVTVGTGSLYDGAYIYEAQ